MTTVRDAFDDPCRPPSTAVYNIRYLSLSADQRDKWNKKINNVQHLVRHNTILGVLETHVDALTAEAFFGSSIEGTRRSYDQGITVFIRKIGTTNILRPLR